MMTWDAPPECPNEHDVRDAVARNLGRPLSAVSQQAVVANANVWRRDDGRWELRLVTKTPAGTRERQLVADRCDVLADATALLLAVAVDPRLAETEHEVVDRTSLAQAPMATTPRAPTTGPAGGPRTLSRSRRVRFGVRSSVGVEGRALPGWGPGVLLDFGVYGKHWRAELATSYWFKRSARLSSDPQVGGDLQLWTGGMRAGPVFTAGPLEIPLRLGLELGVMWGHGIGVLRPRTDRLLWLAVLVGPALAWAPLRWLALWTTADVVLVPGEPPSFELRGIDVVHRAGKIGARFTFGVEVRFP